LRVRVDYADEGSGEVEGEMASSGGAEEGVAFRDMWTTEAEGESEGSGGGVGVQSLQEEAAEGEFPEV
jgi:hypothetical protein